jgi:hypothetical protein
MLRLLSASVLLLAAGVVSAQQVEISGGTTEQKNVVVMLPTTQDANSINVVELPNGQHVSAQVVSSPLNDPSPGKRIAFVLPKLEANATVKVRPGMLNYVKAPPAFKFVENKGESVDLLFDKKPVLRYINAAHDASTQDKHDLTFKPFHHVFDPTEGKTLLTSGAYPFSDKTMQFPHHRGLFLGWMKISYGDKKQADTWHGRKGEFTQHEKMLLTETGEVVGRHRAAIGWYGQDQKLFANEERELSVFHVNGGTLIDFESLLTTKLPKVRLDGDPQHAGFHFRATQEVSKATAKQTYYLRPDGQDKPGATRNWDPKKADPKTVNLPWNAMSFVTNGKRYTTLRMVHPSNPKDSRGSERDYGRFGDYFEYDLTPEKPLKIKYRVWVQEGELTKADCEAMYAAYSR